MMGWRSGSSVSEAASTMGASDGEVASASTGLTGSVRPTARNRAFIELSLRWGDEDLVKHRTRPWRPTTTNLRLPLVGCVEAYAARDASTNRNCHFGPRVSSVPL